MARTWSNTKPVLFFEYDHELTRLAGVDPKAVWPELTERVSTRTCLGQQVVR